MMASFGDKFIKQAGNSIKLIQKLGYNNVIADEILEWAVYELIKTQNYTRCWDVLQKQNWSIDNFDIDKRSEVAAKLDLPTNIHKNDYDLQNSLLQLQKQILRTSVHQKSDHLCYYAAYWLSHGAHPNGIEMLTSLENENVDDVNVEPLSCLINALDSGSNIDMKLYNHVPKNLVQYLFIKFDMLVNNLSPSAVQMLVCLDKRFSLEGYDYLHEHYKGQVSAYVWKIALLEAKRNQQFERGFKILKSIDVKPNMADWQFSTVELLECEFYFHLFGNNDIDRAYEILKQWLDKIGSRPPQLLLIKLLQEFEKDAYNTGKFVNEILFEMYHQDPKWPQSNIDMFISMLQILSLSQTTSSEIQKSILMQLHIVVRDDIKAKREENFVKFLGQCLIFDWQFLQVLFLIMIYQGVVSDELIDAVESDENVQFQLSEICGVPSVVDSIYAEQDLGAVLKKSKVKELIFEQLKNFN